MYAACSHRINLVQLLGVDFMKEGNPGSYWMNKTWCKWENMAGSRF